jgi:hypothetical protein
MPEPRYDCLACAVESNVYGDDLAEPSVFKYDTEAEEWSTPTPLPDNCFGHSAIELDGLIYIVGAGESSCGLLCYDPAAGIWSSLSSQSHTHDGGASFVLGGCLYAAGGDLMEGVKSKIERYDVTTNYWTDVTDLLEGRCNFDAVTIGSDGPAEEQDLFDSLITEAGGRKP